MEHEKVNSLLFFLRFFLRHIPTVIQIFTNIQMSELVKYEKHGHIGIFTLNRPKAMNAVNGKLSAQFEAHLEAFEADENMWIGIVCSSHKKVFCAGADLKAIGSGVPLATVKGGFAGFVSYPRRKPMIAAVDGFALAGGCEIVLACDMCVASESSRFGVPEVKRSLVAAAGGLFRLPQKIPKVVAMEMILTGDPILAARAYELGFVNSIVPKGRFNLFLNPNTAANGTY